MMGKSDYKKMMKGAYTFPESERERNFIKANAQSSMQLWNIVLDEMKFMCGKSIPSVGALFLALLLASRQDDTSVMWYVSGALPLFALLFTAMAKRSERFGMLELEAACRFSLRFVRSVRLLIYGFVSLLLICVCILFIQCNPGGILAETMCFVALPYLVNVFGCLHITRKHHFNDDVVRCTVCTVAACFIPTVIKTLRSNGLFSSGLAVALTLIIAVLTVRESLLFIQEEGNTKWSFC